MPDKLFDLIFFFFNYALGVKKDYGNEMEQR